MFTKILVPKPKNAFQSPADQSFGRKLEVVVDVADVMHMPSVSLPQTQTGRAIYKVVDASDAPKLFCAIGSGHGEPRRISKKPAQAVS
jgi:hypothetical protein